MRDIGDIHTEEQLAIIRNVGYGCRDIGKPCLFFDSYITETTAALQILTGEDADEFIKAYGVYDVSKLEGKPVWVDVGQNRVTINRAWRK